MKYSIRDLPEAPRDYAPRNAKGPTYGEVAMGVCAMAGCFIWVVLLLGM